MKIYRLEEPLTPHPADLAPPEIILASGSPWRQQLLQSVGVRCRAVSPGLDERSVHHEDPVELACALALAKARQIRTFYPDCIVIGADQVAHLDGEAFGKPEDPAAHLRRLQALRGREHTLVVGVAVLAPGLERTLHEASRVRFRAALGDEELAAYVATGEGAGCAGGYQAEGLGAALIAEVRGDWFNVIGLPVYRVLSELRALGWRPFGLPWSPPSGPAADGASND